MGDAHCGNDVTGGCRGDFDGVEGVILEARAAAVKKENKLGKNEEE